ncbi:hypothetical protein VNI00_018755 [Paramarasmius palmivorus]|uniref:Uncharacterized protein n=1 Tax=Paramarasmius palmivorus TaxID=297713 RepID=A0AAW0AWB7_9AGAR
MSKIPPAWVIFDSNADVEVDDGPDVAIDDVKDVTMGFVADLFDTTGFDSEDFRPALGTAFDAALRLPFDALGPAELRRGCRASQRLAMEGWEQEDAYDGRCLNSLGERTSASLSIDWSAHFIQNIQAKASPPEPERYHLNLIVIRLAIPPRTLDNFDFVAVRVRRGRSSLRTPFFILLTHLFVTFRGAIFIFLVRGSSFRSGLATIVKGWLRSRVSCVRTNVVVGRLIRVRHVNVRFVVDHNIEKE